MSKVSITFEFGDNYAAIEFLRSLGQNAVEAVPEGERKAALPAAPASGAMETQSKPAASSAEQPQTNAPALTLEDLRVAFMTYVEKKGGRTAATGKKILEQHGVVSIRDARPEQYRVLIDALATA